MRNLILATTALAALAFAGAASAQSVDFNRSYLHNASGSPQVANANVGAVIVGTNLTGGSAAVGTSLNVTSLDNITVAARVDQLNTSGQVSNLNVNGAVVGRNATFAAQAGGNASTYSADDNLSIRGNMQANTAAQTANLTIESTTVSRNVSGGATAFGNSQYGESVYGGVQVAFDGYNQSNVGTQTANVSVNGGNSFGGTTDLRSLSVGGILEFDAAGNGTYAIEQANGRGSNYFGLDGYAGSSQTANLTVHGGSNFNGATSLGASALGGVVNLSGTGNILAGVTTQNHNSAQVSNLNIIGSSFGSLAGAATSIGTSVSINTRP